MTVLVLAADLDPTADVVADELNRRRVPVFRCDPARFPDQLGLRAELDEGSWSGILRARHRVIDLADLRAAWYRGSALARTTPGSGRTATWADRLGPGGILADLPLLWVNHPAAEADAAYRPVQLSVAARCGLAVPPTLVTNCPDAVRRFVHEQQQITVEPLPDGSIVDDDVTTPPRPPADADADSTDRGVGSGGQIFQRRITDQACAARVTVVGRRSFGAQACAGPAADPGAPDLRPVEVPRPVLASIGRAMSALGLVYAAFDFGVDADGTWWLHHIDPTGEFRFIEDATALPITAAITDLLERGRP